MASMVETQGKASELGWTMFLIALFLVLLLASIAVPYAWAGPELGDRLTRYTVRVTLVFYAISLVIRLLMTPADWRNFSPSSRLARLAWTLGWIAFVVHLAMAFHHYHGWSHEHAVEHVQQRSGFGPGIYVSHLFTLLWTLDVGYWWLRPHGYAMRSPVIDRFLQSFMAFMTFNGTVVYETGLIRWAGVAMFTLLAAAWVAGRRLRDSEAKPESLMSA